MSDSNIIKEEGKKVLKDRGLIDQITNRDIVKAQLEEIEKKQKRIEELESINNELDNNLNKALELIDVLNDLERKIVYYEKQVYRGKTPKKFPELESNHEDKPEELEQVELDE